MDMFLFILLAWNYIHYLVVVLKLLFILFGLYFDTVFLVLITNACSAQHN